MSLVIKRLNPDVYPEQYQIESDDIYICKSPTSNCQTYTIGGIDNIICRDNPIGYLKEIQHLIQKNQVLLDISERWFPTFEKLFKPEDFMFQTKYKNSTGSAMVMCLLKTTSLR